MLKSALLLPLMGFMANLVAASKDDPFSLGNNTAIKAIFPVMNPEWNTGKMGETAIKDLRANLPQHKFTKRLMTEFGDSIPEYCAETRTSGKLSYDLKDVSVYEITFDDSPQTLILCWHKDNTETIEEMVGVLSELPNNIRSAWNIYAQWPGDVGGCSCFTTVGVGDQTADNSVCYGPCAKTCPGCYHHELCNALNGIGNRKDSGWAASREFAESYNKDTKRVVNDVSLEYWSSLCKMVLYDVNVPGGLQNLVKPFGLELSAIQNQVNAVKFDELRGQMVANQTFFHNYPRQEIKLIKKDGSAAIAKTGVTLPYYAAKQTSIGALSNVYGQAQATPTAQAKAADSTPSASASSGFVTKITQTSSLHKTTTAAPAAVGTPGPKPYGDSAPKPVPTPSPSTTTTFTTTTTAGPKKYEDTASPTGRYHRHRPGQGKTCKDHPEDRESE